MKKLLLLMVFVLAFSGSVFAGEYKYLICWVGGPLAHWYYTNVFVTNGSFITFTDKDGKTWTMSGEILIEELK